MRSRFILSLAAVASALTFSVLPTHAASHSGQQHNQQPTFHVPTGWPVKFELNRYRVSANVESLDFQNPKYADAPLRWSDVAWYDRSARPGDLGRSIIFGHLDSTCCPAVFYHLRDSKAGDTVQVWYKSGKPLTFRIMWVHTYPNNALPVKWMYEGIAQRSLLLITCTGVFHLDGSGYDHKFVAYARLVLPNGKLG